MSAIDVAVFGASGYGGQELLRLLAGHPGVRVAAVKSERFAGRPVAEQLPQLGGFFPGLVFRHPEQALPDGCRAAFLATPHGASRALFAGLAERDPELRVVDLSGDFRLRDPERHRAAYGTAPADAATQRAFAYGLTETNREAIAAARCVANPGCFATAAILALAPLAARGLLEGDVTLAQTTGSSGSGATPKAGTHHPERAQDMRAYKVLAHQHEPEIDQELRRLGADGFELGMIPQSGPFARGIFTAAHVRLAGDVDLPGLYREHYRNEFFVRVGTASPALRHVARTNFCDLAVSVRGRRAIVLGAIDNLGKGMAGQAVQNLNLLFGLDETTGLRIPGANP